MKSSVFRSGPTNPATRRRASAGRTARATAMCEQLELRRLFSTFIWANRGSAASDTDGFNSVFGSRAALARQVIDADLTTWGTVISNFNRAGGDNTYSVNISMATSGTSNGASTSGITVDANNIPLSATIVIGRGSDTNGDGKGDGGNWYLNANPYDFSDYLSAGTIYSYVDNAFSGWTNSSTSPAYGKDDLYSVALHELGHAVGFYSSNPKLRALSIDTQQLDYESVPGQIDPVTTPHFWLFNGPDTQVLLTGYNSGGAGGNQASDAGGPEHTSPLGDDITYFGTEYYGNVDLMNPAYYSSTRYVLPDHLALMLQDAYGYTVKLPSSMGTWYDALQPGGNLRIALPNSDNADNVTVSLSGGNYNVTLIGGSPVVGEDPLIITSSFSASLVSSITILAAGHNNNITLNQLGGAPVSIDAGLGHSGTNTLRLNADNNTHNFMVMTGNTITGVFGGTITYAHISSVFITGGSGNDALYYGGADQFSGLPSISFNGGAGTNTFELDNWTSADAWTYYIDPTQVEALDASQASVPTITYTGVQQFRIEGSSGNEAFFLTPAPATFSTTLYGNAGDDDVYIGDSDYGGDPFSAYKGSIRFYGGSGRNEIDVTDVLETSARTYTITPGAFASDLSGAILYDASVQTIDFDGTAAVGSTYNISGTLAGTSLEVVGGRYADTFNVTAASSGFLNLGGALDIFGGGGGDVMTYVESTYNGSAAPYILLTPTDIEQDGNAAATYSGIGYLAIYGPSVNINYYVDGTSPDIVGQTTLYAGNGNNAIYLFPRDASGNLAFPTPIGIAGQGGTDTVTISDQGDAQPITYGFSNPYGAGTQDISGLGAALVGIGSDVENIVIQAGDGDDVFNLNSYQSTSSLTLDGNGGDDTLNLSPVAQNIPATLSGAASMYFDGGDGTNSLNVYNQACSLNLNYLNQGTSENISYFTLQGSYSFGISIPNVQNIAQHGGTGADNFIIRSLAAGASMLIDGGPSADNVLVTSAISNGTTQLIEGPITILGDGTDTINLDDRGDTVGRTFHIDGSSVGSAPGDDLFGPGGSLSVSGGAGNVSVLAGSGADTVFAAPNGSYPVTLNGGAPTAAPGDTLTLDLTDTLNPVFTPLNSTQTAVTSDNHFTLTYAGFENDPSINTVPPVATGAYFVPDPAAQSLDFTFTEPLASTVGVPALTLVDLSTGTAVPVDYSLLAASFDFYAKTLSFTFPGYAGGILPQGLYRATLSAPDTVDRFGNTLAADYSYSFLYVPANQSLAIARGQGTLVTEQVAIDPTGSCDIADNSLIVDYTGASPAADVAALLATGYAGGAWNGPGINSSTAAADPTQLTTIGYAEASDILDYSATSYPSWQGVPVDSTALLIKYTYAGDTDLNGAVNGNDLANLLAGLNGGLSGWVNGDANYDGDVTPADQALLLAALQGQGSPLGGGGSGGGAPTPSATAAPSPRLVLDTRIASYITAGRTLAKLIVELDDAQGHRAESDKSKVTVAISSGPAHGRLLGATTEPARRGRASFTGLSIQIAGTYNLTFTDGAYAPITESLTVRPATPAKLLIAQPSKISHGSPFNLAVSLVDKYGNREVDDTSAVTLLLSSKPIGSSPLSGPTSEIFSDGTAAFPNLTLPDPGIYAFAFADGKLRAGERKFLVA